MSHPLMARADHDERAAQLFSRDLKSYIGVQINPSTRQLATAALSRGQTAGSTFADVEAVFDQLLPTKSFRNWISLKRVAQEMMWDAVITSVDRQIDILSQRAEIQNPMGSVTLSADFEAPAYLGRMDTHLMPGGYTVDEGGRSIRQGAIMDAGGAVYQLGRPLGKMNDGSGVAVIAHIIEQYPNFRPARILDLGTGLGRAAVAAARAFPDAEVHAIDVGPDVLRYAHARAEHLGVTVRFSQQNAEATNFESGSFDLVISSAIFHETSEASIPKIIDESHRLLRSGGLVVNLEVPYRYWDEDILGKLEAEWESHFNNESSYRAAVSADYGVHLRASGFGEPLLGWQVPSDQAGGHRFSKENPSPSFGLYVMSASKA